MQIEFEMKCEELFINKTVDNSVLGWINAISHRVHKYLTYHGFSSILMFFSSLIGLKWEGSGRLHSQK